MDGLGAFRIRLHVVSDFEWFPDPGPNGPASDGESMCPNIRLLLSIMILSAGVTGRAAEPVSFEKRQLTDEYYCDGINHGDFNGDGAEDIVAGPFWYAGPEFRTAHEIYTPVPIPREPSPSNSMFSFVHDFNADGRQDVLVLGRVHKHEAYWYENPGPSGGHWKKHFVFERVRGESPTLVDVDQDGVPELVCHWDNRWGFLKPQPGKPTEPWVFHPVMPALADGEWNQFYHGTGVGDIDGDGRRDLILNDGWWQQPENPADDWIAHRHVFSHDRGGAQMFAVDVDGDGLNDVISSLNAHGWGLAWFQQVRQGRDISFVQHKIMGDRSELPQFKAAFTQPHALDLADVNGDGLPDIVTGKRMWAHGPKGDIEPEADPVLYWFELVRTPEGAKIVPHEIDARSGVGVQVVAADVNGDEKIDILTVSKLGTFVFLQQ